MASVSDIGFGAGLAFVGLGIVGLVITPRPAAQAPAAPSAGAALVPIAGDTAIRGWF